MDATDTDTLLRDCAPDDLQAVRAIYLPQVLGGTATFEETPPTLDELERRWRAVRDAGLPWLVAERAGQVVGYAYATSYRPRAAYRYTVEDSIYLAPEAAGRGLGKRLLARVIADCEAAGVRQMVAVIGDSANAASIGLHRAVGFDMIGVQRSVGWKLGRWIDTVTMQRALGAGDSRPPAA